MQIWQRPVCVFCFCFWTVDETIDYSIKIMKQMSLVCQLGVGSVAARWPLAHPSVGVDPRLNRAGVRGQGWRPGPLAWGRGVELKARSRSWPGCGPHERSISCWSRLLRLFNALSAIIIEMKLFRSDSQYYIMYMIINVKNTKFWYESSNFAAATNSVVKKWMINLLDHTFNVEIDERIKRQTKTPLRWNSGMFFSNPEIKRNLY